MNKHSLINFIGKCQGHRVLVDCIMSGFGYEQSQELLTKMGYRVPRDQYEAFTTVLDIQVKLDIGEHDE